MPPKLPPSFFSKQKLLFIKEQLLSGPDLKSILDEFDAAEGTTATVQSGYSSEERVRSRQTLCVDIKTHYDLIFEHMNALKDELSAFFKVPLHTLQELQFLKYEPGHFFKAHTDTLNYLPQGLSQRQVSVVLYFNDNLSTQAYTGGDFVFFPASGKGTKVQGFPLQIAQNTLLGFRSNTLHEVLPVESGTRYAAVGWFT